MNPPSGIFDKIESSIGYFNPVAVFILSSCFIAYLVYRNNRKNRAADAAKYFRNTVLKSLAGVYPVTSYWPESIYPIFKNSIPSIESAAIEFERFISRKGAFRKAVSNYTECCHKINYRSQVAWEMYPKTREQTGDKTPSPRKEFERLVHNLLSFAKDK